MLDKLNQIAAMLEEAIASHPDSKKKRKPAAEGSPEEEAQESASQEQSEDAPAMKAQKSMRKSMGGMKEPK